MLFFSMDTMELIVVLAIYNKKQCSRVKREKSSAGGHLNYQLMQRDGFFFLLILLSFCQVLLCLFSFFNWST